MGEREKREGREIRERGREIVYEERYLMTGVAVAGRLYRERERERKREREKERERERNIHLSPASRKTTLAT